MITVADECEPLIGSCTDWPYEADTRLPFRNMARRHRNTATVSPGKNLTDEN